MSAFAVESGIVAYRPPTPHLSPVAGTDNAYAWAYEHLLWPRWQRYVRGRSTFEEVSALESSQWLPPEEVEALQLSSLRTLLSYAAEHIPYYREIFAKEGFDPRGVRSRADMQALPLLTRDIIRERYADLVDPAHAGLNHRKGTSGSTGVPLKFEYCNESETWRQATRIRGYHWAGYRIGLPTFFYWPEGANPPKGLTAAKVKVDRALRREVYVDPINQDEASLREAIATLRRVRPHLIIGYTQATVGLAHFINDQGLRDWDDIPVICGAEAVLAGDREALSRAFGPEIFETYGSRETMLIAAECCAHDGLHLSEENLLVEVVKGGKAAGHSEAGDVVITDLHNFGMPMIRYVNGDIATMGDGRICACGRGLRKLARVEGRRADTLHDGKGAPIPGMMFHALFATKDDLARQFQGVQKASGEVVLKVVKGQDWSEAAFAPIVQRLRGYLKGLALSVQYVEHIPPATSGKYRTIVAERA